MLLFIALNACLLKKNLSIIGYMPHRCRIDTHTLLRELTLAPLCTKIVITSTCLPLVAACRAVLPSLSYIHETVIKNIMLLQGYEVTGSQFDACGLACDDFYIKRRED